MSNSGDLLRIAADLWVHEHGTGQGDIYSSLGNAFLQAAESAYFDVVGREPNFPDPPLSVLKKPIEEVCDWIPTDGRYILYYHMAHGDDDDGPYYLYIGKSIRCSKRQREHRKSSSWWDEIDYMEFDLFHDQQSLDEAEVLAIRKYRPRYNVVHNGGHR